MDDKIEIGWLIELRGTRTEGPLWWRIADANGEGGFSNDSIKALRFARKEDAQAYIDDVGWTEVIPTEHQWG